MSPLSELLAQRSYVRFLLARLSGLTANQMLMVAVAWHMYELTSSAWDLGLVGLFQFIPALLVTLPAGHVVDRFHRGRIYAVCMLVQALVAAWLVGATQGQFASRELLFGVSIVLGTARAFQMPAQQALTPLLVPQRLLSRAVALSSSSVQVGVIAGPALGGLLFAYGALTVYARRAVEAMVGAVATAAAGAAPGSFAAAGSLGAATGSFIAARCSALRNPSSGCSPWPSRWAACGCVRCN